MTEVDGEVWVRDLGSTNGTWIDGQRISFSRLRVDEVLAIAHLRYRVEEVSAQTMGRVGNPSAPDDGCVSNVDPYGTALYGEL
jgi:pSer/pThr/pTyr-binding forkhead associated (FHA) protein